MGGIQPDATVFQLSGLGHEFALAVEHATGMGGEQVRDDVTRLEEWQQFTDDFGRVAARGVPDVDHEWQIGLAGGALGQAWHFHAEDLQGWRDHARFDAAYQGLVFVEDVECCIQIDARGGDDVRTVGQARLADVQTEREGPRSHCGAGCMAGTLRRLTSRSCRLRRSSSRRHAHRRGPANAVGNDAVEDVRVQVDQSRGHDLAADVDDTCALGRDRGRHLDDAAAFDGDVQRRIECLRWVDLGPAVQHQVVHTHVFYPSGEKLGSHSARSRFSVDHTLLVKMCTRPRKTRRPSRWSEAGPSTRNAAQGASWEFPLYGMDGRKTCEY